MSDQMVFFECEGKTTIIQCLLYEKMSEIVRKFCYKTGVDKQSTYFLYLGNILNEDETFESLKNSKSKGEKITILVHPLYHPCPCPLLTRSSQIICPECKEIAEIKFEKYKISIKCKNNHIIKNTFLKDFPNTQLIDESKIVCHNCKKNNKNDTYKNIFYYCLNCKQNLCLLCRDRHDRNHNIIEYEQKNFICPEHEDYYSLYCKTCKKNLCSGCQNEHTKCETESLDKLLPEEKDLENRMNELKNNINKLRDDIEKIYKILNSFMENLNIYYNINKNINESFNIQSKNYETLNNLKEINNKDILKDITKIIEEKNLGNKFKYIFDIYTLMNIKDDKNYSEDDENNELSKQIGINNQNMINNNYPMEMGIGMPGSMMFNPMNPTISNQMNNNDEELLKGYQKPIPEPSPTKKKIIFKTSQGVTTELEVDPLITIDELLKNYLKRVGREDLIGDKKGSIVFIFNGCQVKFGDKTTVKENFKDNKFPEIVVFDDNCLISP